MCSLQNINLIGKFSFLFFEIRTEISLGNRLQYKTKQKNEWGPNSFHDIAARTTKLHSIWHFILEIANFT